VAKYGDKIILMAKVLHFTLRYQFVNNLIKPHKREQRRR
jgi:hypothetical protein